MNFLNKTKIAIVVQGTSNYVTEVKNAWKSFKKDLIFSTWKGDEKLYDNSDIVLFNEPPKEPGPFNFNYQKTSTYNGILKAIELGYTHVLKIRSDNIPTNVEEFIKILNPDKLNFLMWDYTSFLWLDYPNLNGYLDDHISFGPIDYMLKLWNIEDNFCHSPEIMLTWSYINKLKNVIDINYLLPHLNNNNDIFYIKFNNQNRNNSFAHNETNNLFGERTLFGRYESVFKNNNEYTKTPEETKKFLNNNYLNFLKYYNPLPEITIYNNNNNNNKNMENIIYPEKKLNIVSNINDIKTDLVISSTDLENDATLIIEYFKMKDIMYLSTIKNSPNPGNVSKSKILSKEKFIKKFIKT